MGEVNIEGLLDESNVLQYRAYFGRSNSSKTLWPREKRGMKPEGSCSTSSFVVQVQAVNVSHTKENRQNKQIMTLNEERTKKGLVSKKTPLCK